MNRVVETAKGVIEYSSVGEGIPVLFIHGGHIARGFDPFKPDHRIGLQFAMVRAKDSMAAWSIRE